MVYAGLMMTDAKAKTWGEHLSTTAAADLLKVTPQTVRRMVDRGDLPAERMENGYHGLMVLARADVLALVERRAAK